MTLAIILTATSLSMHAQGAGGLLLVLNKEDATLSIIDPASGTSRGTIATGESPHEIAVSADGRFAFVTNYGNATPGRSLSMIDIGAMKEARRVDLGELRRPHGISIAQGKVYFTAEANRQVGRYDPQADRVDARIDTAQEGSHMVIAAADGRRLFVSNLGSGSITILDAQGANWQTTQVRVGGGPEGFDVSPDGRALWAAHSEDGGVSVIDLPSRRVTATIAAKTQRSNRLKFTPDGRHALISDLSGGELVVIDTSTRQITKRLKLGRSPEGILVPPGSAVAYVAVTGDNQVAVVGLKSFEVVRTIRTGNGPDGLAWANPK